MTIQCITFTIFILHFKSCYFKLLKSQSKLSATRFTLRYCTSFHRYPIFSKRYSVLCKVYTGYCGTSEIEHGLCACTVDNPLAKARDYLSVQAHKPCSISHLEARNEVDIEMFEVTVFVFSSCIKLLLLVLVTDTWGQLVSTTLNHKTCINTSRQVLEKTLFAINAIFTQDNNLSKPKVEGSLQKTNATCSNVKQT